MNDSANGWIRQPADFRSAATSVSETCAELGLGLLVMRVSPSNREVAQVAVLELVGEAGWNPTHNPQIKSLLWRVTAQQLATANCCNSVVCSFFVSRRG